MAGAVFFEADDVVVMIEKRGKKIAKNILPGAVFLEADDVVVILEFPTVVAGFADSQHRFHTPNNLFYLWRRIHARHMRRRIHARHVRRRIHARHMRRRILAR